MPRGRPPGSKNRSKDLQTTPKIGDNSGKVNEISAVDERDKTLTFQHRARRAELIANEKVARAERMNYDKMIKSDLGADGLRQIKRMNQMETDEGRRQIEAEWAADRKIAEWLSLPLGSQAALFDNDRRPSEERAYDLGKVAGMEGRDGFPPSNLSTSAEGEWVRGWHDGQASLMKFAKKEDEEVAPIVEQAAEVAVDDDNEEDDPRPAFLKRTEREIADEEAVDF